MGNFHLWSREILIKLTPLTDWIPHNLKHNEDNDYSHNWHKEHTTDCLQSALPTQDEKYLTVYLGMLRLTILGL